MKRDYRSPKKFENFVYVSQLLQAEGMRTGIEAHRRNKPYCMGTLYWQLNDVWQVASWSSIDNFGRWKALQYYAREAYSPVAALPIVEDDILKLYGVNDLPTEQKVTLQVRALTFDGKVLSDVTQIDTRISPDTSRMIWQAKTKTVLDKYKPESSVVEITLKGADGKQLYRRLYYLVSPKELSLPRANVSMEVEQVKEGYKLTMTCNRLGKNVFIGTEIDGFFSDNYFDLLPDEKKVVVFKTDRILDDVKTAFTTKSLEDAD